MPLQNTTQQPLLAALTNRATRQALFEHSWNRAEHSDANDTRATIARLAQLRAQRAKLLGYPNYAAWKLEDQMAKTPEAALKFLNALVPMATAKASSEAKDIQAVIDAQNLGFQLQPWDWEFYAEQVRKAKYDLDEDQIKPYFELNNVLQNGVFYAATQLYGITFKERHDIPVYHPDVRVFEVFDTNGKPLALFYCDYFKRDNKNGGAWMSNFVDQSKPARHAARHLQRRQPAQARRPANPRSSASPTSPPCSTSSATPCTACSPTPEYPTLSGTSVARDFVEFPSQFNEHWATYPAVFNHYAKHYKTGAPMPAELAAKIKKIADVQPGLHAHRASRRL